MWVGRSLRELAFLNLKHAIHVFCCTTKVYFPLVHCVSLFSEKSLLLLSASKAAMVHCPLSAYERSWVENSLWPLLSWRSSVPAASQSCSAHCISSSLHRIPIRQSEEAPWTIWKIFVYSNTKGLEFNTLTKYLFLWNAICSVILVYTCFEIPNLRFFYVKEYRAQVFLPLIYYRT